MREVTLYEDILQVSYWLLLKKDVKVSNLLRPLPGHLGNPYPVCLSSKEDPPLVKKVMSPGTWDLIYSCVKVLVCRGVSRE